ncbi:ABC transporter ATP-binding protein/permease [Vallitalea sp.]|jgi:ABC-type lipoprotein export system ATPase subunit/ABC-type lipoprotein release transport system permease subunit|uniref:ABC transporter ATP-binding protein/permease n=1 Tax=Vallitalea sp. TaxID=1882829 RepID=UPI0025F2C44E|nr:ATP-binding cassette domain-containing protein [Vallitalea sp.]MCT4687883.1 ATP-binding cassette domain-containing protein [Vallitalea sp.]
MIKIKGIKKIYNPEKQKPLTALNDINLEFGPGEFVCIIGKSGSGKSTLLNIIAGLDKPTAGSVFIDNEDIAGFSDLKLANCRKNKIGFVFQDFQLMEHLTVLENVELGLSMNAVDSKEKRRRAKSILMNIGLYEHLNHKPSELSGGQKQRVSIARALVKNPDIIIADEPTGALDSKTSIEMLNILKDIADSGKLVIVVTHDYEVKDYSTRIVELKDGQVIKDEIKQKVVYKHEKSIVQKRSFDIRAAFRLSWKRLLERKWRYLLVSVSMIIGICSLAIAFGISNGIKSYSEYANKRIIDNKKLTFIKKDALTSEDYFALKKNKKIKLLQDEYVLNAKHELDNKEEISFKVKSIIQEEYQKDYTTPEILHGRLPQDNKNEIALSYNIAMKLAKDGNIQELIGKKIESKFLAVDDLNNYPSRWDKQSLNIVGITQKTLIGEDYAYLPYETQKTFVRRSRFLGKNEDIPTNKMSVYLEDNKDIGQVYNTYVKSYDITRPEDVLKGLTKVFKNFNLIILGAALLILLISALMIGIILFISVLERQREIGLLISIGGTKKDIKKIFVTEGLLLGTLASTAGVILSIVMFLAINPMAIKHMNYPIYNPNILTLMIALTVGIIVSLVSSIVPAVKASKLSPIELLRRN